MTWIACLHPENAEVTIDQRFFIPGNPWWTVYEGAKRDIPTATAVPVSGVPEQSQASSESRDFDTPSWLAIQSIEPQNTNDPSAARTAVEPQESVSAKRPCLQSSLLREDKATRKIKHVRFSEKPKPRSF